MQFQGFSWESPKDFLENLSYICKVSCTVKIITWVLVFHAVPGCLCEACVTGTCVVQVEICAADTDYSDQSHAGDRDEK